MCRASNGTLSNQQSLGNIIQSSHNVYYVKLKLLRGHRWMPLASYQSHQPDKAHFRVGCYQNGLIQTGHLFLIHEKEKTTT